MKVKMMQVGPIGTNCYILESEHQIAVIDPGDEAERILSVLKELEGQVEYILLTHGHYDHTPAVPALHQSCTRPCLRPKSTSIRPTPTGRATTSSPWPVRWRICTTTTRGTPSPWGLSQ